MPPPRDDLRFSNTTSILQKKKTMWFTGVEVEQETSAPSPKKKSWIRPWFRGNRMNEVKEMSLPQFSSDKLKLIFNFRE